ncbi:kinase-like domain-containing protein [Biscogniauxia marginata]|nr:kinase-like domain-containing protein [Biscogniauxia marginata]
MASQSRAPASGTVRYPTTKIKDAFSQSNVKESTIHDLLEHGYSDFGIPIPRYAYPSILTPSQHARFRDIQPQFLDSYFFIQPPDEWPGDHFNLSSHAISSESTFPNGLEYVGCIGRGNYSQVDEVRYRPTGGVFALKRIERRQTRKEELEEMKYVSGELSALRKIRKPTVQHFVKLVASYTDEQHIGMVLSPVADCNLGQFLDKFNDPGKKRDEGLLGGFFGCLATALAYLHYTAEIRHKDIKPENILVKGNNIYLSDFGIAFDWSETGITTTRDEMRKTTKYCSPELFKYEPRNSKSDIWSLGCVFLEMIAVLKGKTRRYIHDELTSRGTYFLCQADEGAIKEIISMMREDTTQYGNEPLVWIEKMLRLKAEERPTADHLREEILHAGKAHCGFCCFRKNILEEDRVDVAPSSQSPPIYATELFTAKVYVPSAVNWIGVTLAHLAKISSNWISPELVDRANLQLDTIAPESVMLDGRQFNSTGCTKLTWTIENATRTTQDVFLVAAESMAVDMIIPSTNFDTLRQSVTIT